MSFTIGGSTVTMEVWSSAATNTPAATANSSQRCFRAALTGFALGDVTGRKVSSAP